MEHLSMSEIAIPEPSTVADERTTLVQFLDFYRAVLERKVDGLDEAQVRITVAASSIDLLGLTRHMADVERWWFRTVFTGEVDHGRYDDPDDRDADWHHRPDDTLLDALSHWHEEVARAREIVDATPSLDTIGAVREVPRGSISLRWILVHLIEEYARHVGHADLIREAIDGTTGD
jgi:uncharacterized damage-inducible protein DinB